MSRKDYVTIAAAIRTELELEGGSHYGRELYRGVAVRIADGLAADNPRFDRRRFMAAIFG